MISQTIDGGATEADGGASAPLGPSVATPLITAKKFPTFFNTYMTHLATKLCFIP